MLKSHYNVKLRHNQQVKRDLMPVAWFLRNVAELPQVIIDYIMELVRTRSGTNYRLKVVPLRRLQLLLPDLQRFALNPLLTESPHRAYYDPWGGSSGFSSLDPNVYPRRTHFANPTRFDQLVTGNRYLTDREDPPKRIVEGPYGLGTYGERLGYGSFQ